ncbi:unnamed protein product [Sphagnum troendelagicum]
MDKPKSKENLRAAGKKRFEEYRQKRQQKGSSNTSVKASAEDEQSSEHQTSDSISDTDGDDAASAGIVSTEEDDSTLTTGFALEIGNPESNSQPSRGSIGSNGDLHDSQERSRWGARNDVDSHKEPNSRSVLYEADSERDGWNVPGGSPRNFPVESTQLDAQWRARKMCDRVEKSDSNMHQCNHVHGRTEEDLSCSLSEDMDSRDGLSARDIPKGVLEDIQSNCSGVEDLSSGCTQEDVMAESSRSNITPDLKQSGPVEFWAFNNFLQHVDRDEAVDSGILTREEYLEQEHFALVNELNKSHRKLEASLREKGNEVKDFMSKVGTLKAQMAQWQTHEPEQVSPPMPEAQLEWLERSKSQLQGTNHEEKCSVVAWPENLGSQTEQTADVREQLLSTDEASEGKVDCLTVEMARLQQQSKDEVDSMREERSQLVAQLQTALEQIQAVTEREALLASELKGLQENKDHEKAMFASEMWKLPPQQDSGGEGGTFLATSVNQPPSQLKKVAVLREEVGLASEVDKLVATECKEHAEGLGDEMKQLETLSVMDGLRQHVQRQEEKKTQQATSLCESCQSLQEDSVAEASLADVTDMREEEIVQQDLQRLDIKIGNTKESQEKDEEVTDSFGKVMKLQQQLKELEEENANLPSRLQAAEQLLKVHSDENEQLRNQLETILQEQKMREVEISSELRTWKEHADSLEVEKLRNLSVIEESYQHLQRLEEENKELVTSSSECAQSLQAALQEITRLANEVDKLEHEKDLQIGKTWVQAAELQKAQEQLQAASERDIRHGSELKELDVERVELQTKVQELQLQLHGLNEENVHVVAELRELGQKLEAVAAEKKLLATNVDQLVEERQKREAEIAEELATWKEHVQNLEAEKMEFLSSAEDLNQQIWRLGEDKKKLINESNQSLQELWGENATLKKQIGKLEAEKDRHDGERLELVAGLQTVWEKLQAANERETFLTKEVTGLQGWRDSELTRYVAKVQELTQQLQELGEKSDVAVAKSLETSHMLDELQMDNVRLINEVSELVQERERREEEMAREQATWKEKFEAERSNLQLENENLKSVSEDLHKQLERSGEEIKQWGMKSAEFSLMLEEIQEEKTRLVGELDKLEEVKERQEGERLELAAELQKAWNRLQEVGTSESNLTSELQVLREDTEKERVKFAEEVQDLQQQLQKLREDNHQLLIRVQGLMQTLEELHDAKELQEANSRLVIEVAKLEQEKVTIDAERVELLGEMQALKLQVKNVERDKSKLASDIEELNQWLHRPAAEKRHLATKLDEVTQLLQRLQVENSELVGKVGKLEQEIGRIKEENGMLNLQVGRLEEERSSWILECEESHLQLQQLEEEMASLADSSNLVEELGGEISTLKAHVFMLVEDKGNLTLGTELDAVTQVLQRLQVDNFQLVSKVNKLEQEIETRTVANKTLNLQLQSLEHEKSRFISEHEESHLQLQLLEEEMASLTKSSSLVQDLGEEISILKSNIFRLVEEEGHRLSDGRALLHEQMPDVSHERD